MRVVDEDRERLSLVDGVEAAGNALDGLDPGLDRAFADAEGSGGSCRRERVLAVEAAGQLEVDAAERVTRAERDRIGDLRRETFAVLVADVDDGARGLREQPALRLEVVVHRRVEVQVI